jgi:hypothetical protein
MSNIDQQCPICSSTKLKGSVYRPECEACNWFDDNADVIYMLVPNIAEWEDLILYKNKEDAIAASIKYYKNTIQIFKKKDGNGYEPSYLYYINGKLQSNI